MSPLFNESAKTFLSIRRSMVSVFLVLLNCAPIAAQTVTATLVGAVRDASGGAIPQAAVTVRHIATNATRNASTNEQGNYTLTHLRPGVYQVEAEHRGFKRAIVENVELLVEQTARVDLVLPVGEVTESVEVTSAPLLVATDSSAVGQVIDQNQMVNLPLKGRGFYELALLAPGTTPKMPGSFVGNRRPTPGGLNAPAFSVGGGRETSNGYLIDGVDAQDPHYLSPSIFPSVDAIQEFKLQTSVYSAEFGRFAAQINATTKSGTNDWHGSVYHFLRNDVLDAANFFDNFTGVGKAPLRYNQFGATLGGPASVPKVYTGRDRTFFFVSYEGTRIRRGRTAQLSVPTAEQRNGDFSRLGFRGNRPISDPSTTRPNPSGSGFIRDPFPNNLIPANRITPFARTLLSLYPQPVRDVATGNNFFAGLSDVSDNNQILWRIDHRFDANHSLSFRHSFFDGLESSKSPIDQGGSSTDVRTHNIALSYIHIFTPATLYELRLGYNRPSYLILQDGAFGRDVGVELGLKNLLTDPIGRGVPNVSLTGFSTIGTDTNPTTQLSNVYQMVNHLTLVRGAHSLKLGADLRKTNYNDRSERFVRGSFSFTGAMTADPQTRNTTGVSLADLLLGLPLTAGGSNTSLAGNFNGFSHHFFVQDDWKFNSRVTLNLGLRYELNTRYTDVQNRLTAFDLDYPGGRLLLSGTSQSFIPGRGRLDGPATPRGLIPTDRNNWTPRVGVAIRPFAHNRTAVRMGYGIFYSMIELQDLRTWVRNPPFGEVVELQADQNANANGPSALRVNELFPTRGTPASRPNVFGPTKDYPEPYYQQWNFTVQHELPGTTVVELGYLGSKGTRLVQRFNANQATLDADPARPTPILNRRPFPVFGNTVRIGDPGANSTYHAMIVRLERRLAQGLAFLSSYTWSKSLDGASLIDDAPRDIRNRRLHKGRSQFDVRHRAVVSGTWELPIGPGKRYLPDSRFWGQALGGWQVNSIVDLHTGFPFNVGVTGDVCNCGAASQLAQQAGDPRSGFDRQRERWFNTTAFAAPERGTLGNSGRNILDGPGRATVDFSLFRNIVSQDNKVLQFRAEFFNLFNRTNFGQPGSTVGTPSYGIIQSAGDPRQIQFALKFRF
ncbi:MAG: carboxypeptidase regulatory-like domain-containing protein [Acidobacteria bacterium]|nr:carboxypeptidase regulatory-like domain-containing protein [Acidobacteriota bacterium]